MHTQQNYLNEIVEGMEVFDRDAARIGVVKALHFGEGSVLTSNVDIVSMSESILEVIGEHSDLPTVLYARLYEEGFIYVSRGLLRRSVLVFPDQIDTVSENAVYLNLDQEDLLKV